MISSVRTNQKLQNAKNQRHRKYTQTDGKTEKVGYSYL